MMMRLVFVTSGFSGIHLAYGVMVIGIIFCFVISRNQKKEMRKAVDAFAFPFVRISNYISPTAPENHLAVEKQENGVIRVLPPEQQPGAIRAIMKRANEETPVKLFAEMADAADEVKRLAGINRTRKAQFADPVEEILLLTHTFLTGCEDVRRMDTTEKVEQFESFLQKQVKYRMILLRRISGGSAEEYRELNRVYAREMEMLEKKEGENH